jgi:hypothetical protein
MAIVPLAPARTAVTVDAETTRGQNPTLLHPASPTCPHTLTRFNTVARLLLLYIEDGTY